MFVENNLTATFFKLHAYTSENTLLVCWRCFSRGRPAQRKELKVIITSVMNQKSALLAAVAFAAVIPQAFGNPGDQRIVRDVVAAKVDPFSVGVGTAEINKSSGMSLTTGWTSIVPMNINNDGLTDLLSYNAVTGRAGFQCRSLRRSTSCPGCHCSNGLDVHRPDEHQQRRADRSPLLQCRNWTGCVFSRLWHCGKSTSRPDVTAATGWTSIVPNGHRPRFPRADRSPLL